MPRWVRPPVRSVRASGSRRSCAAQLTASNLGVTETRSRMVRLHFCQSRVHILGNMAVLLFGVVIGVGTKRGFVGVAPFVLRTSNDGHDVDSLCAGTFGANGRQRGLETIYPGLFGGQLPGPCLIDDPVRRVAVLGARGGQANIVHAADAGGAPRIAVGFGVFVGVAVVGESALPFGLEIAETFVEASIPPFAAGVETDQFGAGEGAAGRRRAFWAAAVCASRAATARDFRIGERFADMCVESITPYGAIWRYLMIGCGMASPSARGSEAA